MTLDCGTFRYSFNREVEFVQFFTLCAAMLVASQAGTLDPPAIEAWMRDRADAGFEARLAEIARMTLGATYADGPLGEGPDGRFDTDPLIDLERYDCVTYIEQCVALAAEQEYEPAVDLLQRIRYAGGRIDYEYRNHFFVADWLDQNPWCRDVTARLDVATAELTRTISKRGFFQRVDAAGLGENMPDREVTVRVLPIDAVEAAEPMMPDVAVITFVGKIDWLFALHCGLYLRDDTGQGKLYHASSKAGEVVAVSLTEYCSEQQDRYVGILVHEIKEPAWEAEQKDSAPEPSPAR